jgi:methionyl-tRNA formyltransferase
MSVLDTIVLLTGPVEHPILASALVSHNTGLTVKFVSTLADITALGPELLNRARLVAYTTGVVVPPGVIDELGYGAYNFHPGSPHYPGLAPAQFAVYDGASEFGATAHIMSDSIDAGPIVGAELFSVPHGISVADLEALTYLHLARLFRRLAKALATEPKHLQEIPIRWSGQKSSRRSYAAMCDIAFDMTKEELVRRIEAFGNNRFGLHPTIRLHGFEFQIVSDSSSVCDVQLVQKAVKTFVQTDTSSWKTAQS